MHRPDAQVHHSGCRVLCGSLRPATGAACAAAPGRRRGAQGKQRPACELEPRSLHCHPSLWVGTPELPVACTRCHPVLVGQTFLPRGSFSLAKVVDTMARARSDSQPPGPGKVSMSWLHGICGHFYEDAFHAFWMFRE